MQSLLLWEVWSDQSAASLCDWWADKAFDIFGKKEERERQRESEEKQRRQWRLCAQNTCTHYPHRCKHRATVQAFWIIYEISQYRNWLIKQFQSPVCNFPLLITFALTLISILHSCSVFQRKKSVQIGCQNKTNTQLQHKQYLCCWLSFTADIAKLWLPASKMSNIINKKKKKTYTGLTIKLEPQIAWTSYINKKLETMFFFPECTGWFCLRQLKLSSTVRAIFPTQQQMTVNNGLKPY